jgi:ethanolamine utilization protein
MNEELKNEIIEIIKKELNALKNKKDQITILGEDNLLKQELENSFEIVKNAEKIIVSTLSIPSLVNISMGTYSTEQCEQLLKLILENKQIFILEEGIEWRNYSLIPLVLRKKYLSYEEKLKEYGVIIVKKAEIKNLLENKGMELEIFEKVLDEKKIKESLVNRVETLYISEETIITELAKDIIRKNNIKLVRR